MEIRNVKGLNKCYSLFEILIRFSRKSYDHIGADRAVGHDFLNMSHTIRIKFTLIPSTHQTQDPVAPALQRNVKMRHEFPAARDEFNNFIGKQVGFNGRNPEPLNLINLIQLPDQSKKILLSFSNRSVGNAKISKVDSGQHNFLHPIFS